MRSIMFSLLVLAALARPVSGSDIFVPGDYATIQDAIDGASFADRIIVADGTYTGSKNRNLDFRGKAIRVSSANGPLNCIIDCQNAGRGFNFHSGEADDAIVDGFTIVNGAAGTGGGMAIQESSPTILNCIIRNCVSNLGYSVGGGIMISRGAAPLIFNCLVTGCRSDGGYYAVGGGIYIFDGAPHLIHCTITGNDAVHGAGGIYLEKHSLTMTGCIVWGNSPSEVQLYSGTATISYCDIRGGMDGEGNINVNPRFIDGIQGDHYLSQTAAGQEETSGCVDAGGSPSRSVCAMGGQGRVCLDSMTTRTDMIGDIGPVDIGFHHPNAIQATPTPGPTTTPSVNNVRVRMEMPSQYFTPGSACWLRAHIENGDEQPHEDMPLFVVLDIVGEYWFWDGWTQDVDYRNVYVPMGNSMLTIVPEFSWPDTGPGVVTDIVFWGALLTPDLTSLFGQMSNWTFDFGPE